MELFYDKATQRDEIIDIGFDSIEKELYLLEYYYEYPDPCYLEVKMVDKVVIKNSDVGYDILPP